MQKAEFVQRFVNEKMMTRRKKRARAGHVGGGDDVIDDDDDNEETQLLTRDIGHKKSGAVNDVISTSVTSASSSDEDQHFHHHHHNVHKHKKKVAKKSTTGGSSHDHHHHNAGEKYGSTKMTSEQVELDTERNSASYEANSSSSPGGAMLGSQSGAKKLKKHQHHDYDKYDMEGYGGESDHCHDSSDERSVMEEKKRRKAMRKLLVATALSFLFMIMEIVGGYLANSLAIMTDASHLLTDVSSFLISIIALKMASRPISTKMTFGWHRAEVIGALISVLAIWILTGILVYLAIYRVVTNNYKVEGETMLITAAVAVGFNVLLGLVLHEHGHGHSHGGHSHHDHESGSEHSHNHHHDEESGNVNVRAAFIHVIGDLLQSLGVLTAAFIIYFKPEYKIADPICTFLFSLLVLFTTITILRDTVIVIMEGTPVGVKYDVVKEKLLEIPHVTAVHDLRIWSLTLNQTVMSAHLAIDRQADQSIVLKRATRRLKNLYNFHSLTIQVEYYSPDMVTCKKCKPAT